MSAQKNPINHEMEDDMSLSTMALFAALGLSLVAGILTTVAGMGGGLVLLLCLSLLIDPLSALALTAPALLVGNLHRASLYRLHIDRRQVRLLVLGGFPGAVMGGALSMQMPESLISLCMAAMGLAVVAKGLGWIQWRPGPQAGLPVGFFAGLVSATSGGAGVLLAPFLMARELTGTAYVGTMAAVAVALHLGRLIALGAGGVADAETLVVGALMAAGIAGGNLIGDALRRQLGSSGQQHVQQAALGLCMVLSLGEGLL